MKIYYSSQFAKEYRRLPQKIKNLAESKEKLFRQNPFHPQLKTYRLKGKFKEFWSFSIDYRHRIIFEFIENHTVWFHSVGTHSIYE